MTSNILKATDLETTLDKGDAATPPLRGRLSIEASPELRDRLLAVLDGHLCEPSSSI